MFGDLEQFGGPGGNEGSEGVSEAALEAFREQMKAAGQQLKALQKGEQKKKKKEDKLAKIITQFLQKKSKRTDLAFLAAEALALNIPPAFVLSILLLGDQESQKDLTMAAVEDDKGLAVEQQRAQEDTIDLSGNDLSYMMTDDEAQTVQLHGELIPWVDMMYVQAKNDALRLTQHAHDEDGTLRPVMIQFPALSMKYFLEDHGLAIPTQNLETLSTIILAKIFKMLKMNMDKLQSLREAEFGGLPGEIQN